MAITGIQMRSSKWQAMTYTVPSGGCVGGDMVKINDTVGVYFETKAAGALVAVVTQSDKILLPKKDGSGEAIAQGAKVYYEAASKKLTATAGANTLCGRCIAAAGADDTTVLVAFNGLAAA